MVFITRLHLKIWAVTYSRALSSSFFQSRSASHWTFGPYSPWSVKVCYRWTNSITITFLSYYSNWQRGTLHNNVSTIILQVWNFALRVNQRQIENTGNSRHGITDSYRILTKFGTSLKITRLLLRESINATNVRSDAKSSSRSDARVASYAAFRPTCPWTPAKWSRSQLCLIKLRCNKFTYLYLDKLQILKNIVVLCLFIQFIFWNFFTLLKFLLVVVCVYHFFFENTLLNVRKSWKYVKRKSEILSHLCKHQHYKESFQSIQLDHMRQRSDRNALFPAFLLRMIRCKPTIPAKTTTLLRVLWNMYRR